MHPVASSPQGPAVGSVGGALCGRSSEGSVCVGGTVAAGSTPGQSEGAVAAAAADLWTLRAQAGGGVLGCHGDQVVVVVPGILSLLYPVAGGVFGGTTVLQA